MKNIKKFIKIMSLMESYVWLYMIGLIVSVIASVAFLLLNAFANKNMINAVTQGEYDLLVQAIILATISITCVCIIDPASSFLYNFCIKKVMSNIKIKLYQQIQTLDSSYFIDTHSGDIISRITNDVNSMEMVFTIIKAILLTIIAGISTAISMCILNWKISLILILTTILCVWINLSFSKILGTLSKELQNSLAKITEKIVDTLAGLRVIKLFNLENQIQIKYMKEVQQLYNINNRKITKNAQLNCLNYICSMLSFGFVFLTGCMLAMKGTIDFGTIIAMITLQNGLSFTLFLECGDFIVQFQSALAGGERVLEIFDMDKEPLSYPIEGVIREDDIICFDKVTYKQKNKNILDKIDITVKKGEKIALVGSSGGGKSSILKLLLGFYPPDSGKITIYNKELKEYNLKQLRENFAYVPQDCFLFDVSIEENIQYGNLEATKEEIISAAKAVNAHEFIMRLPDKYQTRVGELGNKLSGGQRQRIAIARALLKKAPILLIDEGTASLDAENERIIQNLISKNKNNQTVILVAHRLSTIINAQEIYVIEDGKVVEKGNHLELINNKGRYFELYQIQVKDNLKSNDFL